MSRTVDPDSGPDSAARFRAIFDSASIGIVCVAPDGSGGYEANAAAKALLGYGDEEMTTLSFGALVHPDDLERQTTLHAELLAGTRQQYELEKRLMRKDGSTVWVQTRTSLIPGTADDGRCAIVMIQDITERRLAEESLRESRDRLELIVDTQRQIATAGNDLDRILQLIVERSMELTRADGAQLSLIVGEELVVSAADGTTRASLGRRRRIEESVAHHAFEAGASLLIERCEGDPRINPVMQAQHGDRSLICVPLFHDNAPVASLHVLRRSETDRLGVEEVRTLELVAVVLASAVSRAAEFKAKRLQLEALARFQATYDSAMVGMMTVKLDGTIIDANPAMHGLLAAADGGLEGRAAGDLLSPTDRERVGQAFGEMFAAGSETMRIEHRLKRCDGTLVWVDTALSLVEDVDGGERVAIALLQDITQRKTAEAALLAQSAVNRYQALHDAMTDLPNRALFREALADAVGTDRRGAVLIMDLDGFKEINDSLGHSAGDEVLVELGRRLAAVMRETDLAARLGGDEFAILLSDLVSPADVEHVVTRVQAALAEPLLARGVQVAISAPIGIALFPQDGDSVDAVIHAADVAMYQAKRSGSGHVFHHDVVVGPTIRDCTERAFGSA